MYLKLANPIPDHLIVSRSPFGSHTYGTATENSDNDEVCIVSKPTGEFILQYKNWPSDSVYVDIKYFHEVLEIGGNQNFFETVHTPEWQENYPAFKLKNHTLGLYTTKQARGYIGLAHRDLKPQFVVGRIWHINRCLYIAEKIMNRDLLVLSDIKNMQIEDNPEKLREKMQAMRVECQRRQTLSDSIIVTADECVGFDGWKT